LILEILIFDGFPHKIFMYLYNTTKKPIDLSYTKRQSQDHRSYQGSLKKFKSISRIFKKWIDNIFRVDKPVFSTKYSG